METRLDVVLTFPSEIDTDTNFKKLRKYFDSIESIENCFKIEFSCGDGKFFEDFYQWSENQEALICVVSDQELEKYDGVSSLDTPARLRSTKKILKVNKPYRFTVKYYPIPQHEVYCMNGKEVHRRWVG